MATQPAFTPGPWEVRVNGVFLRIVHGEHKSTVADGIVSEGNARLIAAAPDLLEALEPFTDLASQKGTWGIISKTLDDMQPLTVTVTKGQMKRAFDTIAKATGAL